MLVVVAMAAAAAIFIFLFHSTRKTSVHFWQN